MEINPSDDRYIEKQRKKPTLPKATIISLFARQCSFSCFFFFCFVLFCLVFFFVIIIVIVSIIIYLLYFLFG